MPKKFKRKAKIILDMTPMVDIGFLLVIFFMSTYHAREPEIVEIELPHSQSPFKVPEEKVLTIKVTKGDSIWIRAGTYGPGAKEEYTPFENLESVLIKERSSNPNMAIVVKADSSIYSGRMLKVMDVLQKTNNTRFSLVTTVEAKEGG